MASYLDASGHELSDLLKTNRSWTSLCREAGKLDGTPGPRELELVKRVRAFAHVDDRRRRAAYRALLTGDVGTLSAVEQRLAEMLYYSLFPGGSEIDGSATGLDAVRGEAVAAEIAQVIDISFDAARRSTVELGRLDRGFADVPLDIHASYLREEILAGLGWTAGGRKPNTMREGVVWCEELNTDAFLITLQKSGREYSPTTMYRDFALSLDPWTDLVGVARG